MFNGPPFFEDWTLESALAEFDYASSLKGYLGLAYALEGRLRGFSWGYDLPSMNSGRVDYERITEETAKGTFYLAEVAVAPELWNRNIGTRLVESLDSSIESSLVAVRTLNPAMLRIAEKVWGREVKTFPEESGYEGGMVYVYER